MKFRYARSTFAAALLLLLQACFLFPSHMGSLDRYPPVVVAATAGDIPAVKAALDSNPRIIHMREWGGATLLHDAVGHDEEEMAAFLLSRGAKVNARDSGRLTPLHWAAQNGNVPIIRVLLDHGAKVNPVDTKGWTPFDRALLWHHQEAAEYLQRNGGRSRSNARQ